MKCPKGQEKQTNQAKSLKNGHLLARNLLMGVQSCHPSDEQVKLLLNDPRVNQSHLCVGYHFRKENLGKGSSCQDSRGMLVLGHKAQDLPKNQIQLESIWPALLVQIPCPHQPVRRTRDHNLVVVQPDPATKL